MYRSIKRYNDFEILKGYIEGTVKFNSGFIEFEQHRYHVNSIDKIQLSTISKEGDYTAP